mgnify:CR=1 FL=1|jgi:hypothetical protein
MSRPFGSSPSRNKKVTVDKFRISRQVEIEWKKDFDERRKVQAVLERPLDPKEIFDKYDLDGQGRLEIDEFKPFLLDLGLTRRNGETEEMHDLWVNREFKKADTGDRGFLVFKQFLAYYESLKKKAYCKTLTTREPKPKIKRIVYANGKIEFVNKLTGKISHTAKGEELTQLEFINYEQGRDWHVEYDPDQGNVPVYICNKTKEHSLSHPMSFAEIRKLENAQAAARQ